ncbi:MAG: hypothetical protein ACETWG_07230 [Candidatus Neomarinimicrobiota bacterium]
MATFKDIIDTFISWLKVLIDLGLSLIVVFLLIDVLFRTGFVIDNVSDIVATFAENGVVGLIALLLFVLIYKK